MALLAGVGPMGLGAIDYAIHCDRKPGLLVVTDISVDRLKRAEQLFPVSEAKKNGVELIYLNTGNIPDPVEKMMHITKGKGYDDVFVFAPVKQVVEQADKILGRDGCLNFFAGPGDQNFSANLNFYNVHYNSTHIVGTSGGNTDDMIESLDLMSKGRINPASMITHVGGLNAVIETTRHLPEIPGGKKLMYTNIELDLVALDDLEKRSGESELFKSLAKIVEKHQGLWSVEAEDYLLLHAKPI
jgi:threonine dehydrogenase-like Zn-dependent dehydrogenase